MDGLDIPARLERLERQNRRLRVVVSLLGIAMLSVFCLAAVPQAPPGKQVVTHSLVVVDEQGNECARLDGTKGRATLTLGKIGAGQAKLWSDPATGPMLSLIDASGQEAVMAAVLNGKVPAIGLAGAGKDRLQLRLSEARQPSIMLSDEDGTTRVALMIEDGRNASLRLQDNGKKRASIHLSTTGDGSSLMSMRSEDTYSRGLYLTNDSKLGVGIYIPGNERSGEVRLCQEPGKGPGLSMIDAKGKSRLSVGILPDGTPMVGLDDQEGTPRAVLAVHPEAGPGLAFYEENGKGARVIN